MSAGSIRLDASGPSRRRLGWRAVVAGGLIALALAFSARAAGLVADLSHNLIAITTAFTGSEVLLFGALDEPGGDIVAVVTGPRTRQTVRERSRVLGMWMPTDTLRFSGVPSF